jgi:hypothetical protein
VAHLRCYLSTIWWDWVKSRKISEQLLSRPRFKPGHFHNITRLFSRVATPCSLVAAYQRFGGLDASTFRVEVSGLSDILSRQEVETVEWPSSGQTRTLGPEDSKVPLTRPGTHVLFKPSSDLTRLVLLDPIPPISPAAVPACPTSKLKTKTSVCYEMRVNSAKLHYAKPRRYRPYNQV